MIAVPCELPLTTPPLVTEAIDDELLLQVPPEVVLDKVTVELKQTAEGPLILPATVSPVTIIVLEVDTEPQVFVIV
jgi:hypothetical protein